MINSLQEYGSYICPFYAEQEAAPSEPEPQQCEQRKQCEQQSRQPEQQLPSPWRRCFQRTRQFQRSVLTMCIVSRAAYV